MAVKTIIQSSIKWKMVKSVFFKSSTVPVKNQAANATYVLIPSLASFPQTIILELKSLVLRFRLLLFLEAVRLINEIWHNMYIIAVEGK